MKKFNTSRLSSIHRVSIESSRSLSLSFSLLNQDLGFRVLAQLQCSLPSACTRFLSGPSPFHVYLWIPALALSHQRRSILGLTHWFGGRHLSGRSWRDGGLLFWNRRSAAAASLGTSAHTRRVRSRCSVLCEFLFSSDEFLDFFDFKV